MRMPKEVCHPREIIGRRLYSGSHITRRGKVNYRAFYKPGESRLSVDRLTYAPTGFLEGLAMQDGRDRDQTFHGWAGRRAELIEDQGVAVTPSPILNDPEIPDNEYHADIVLPEGANSDLERKEQANKLVRFPWHVMQPSPEVPVAG